LNSRLNVRLAITHLQLRKTPYLGVHETGSSSHRFKRRYDLAAIISRLAFIALRTAPLPYRFLKPAEVVA
jgi:hypothetical protein